MGRLPQTLGGIMEEHIDNFDFIPRQILSAGIRPTGPNIQIAQPIIQRTTALRAYNAYSSAGDWMERTSIAYVVALGTRSADIFTMKRIQAAIPESPPFNCAICRDLTIGIDVIRRQLFPKLHSLRRHANDLIHHLDDPSNLGVATLNIEGVFEYCYHLFEDQNELLFGQAPEGTFKFAPCKDHRQKVRK